MHFSEIIKLQFGKDFNNTCYNLLFPHIIIQQRKNTFELGSTVLKVISKNENEIEFFLLSGCLLFVATNYVHYFCIRAVFN